MMDNGAQRKTEWGALIFYILVMFAFAFLFQWMLNVLEADAAELGEVHVIEQVPGAVMDVNPSAGTVDTYVIVPTTPNPPLQQVAPPIMSIGTVVVPQ